MCGHHIISVPLWSDVLALFVMCSQVFLRGATRPCAVAFLGGRNMVHAGRGALVLVLRLLRFRAT